MNRPAGASRWTVGLLLALCAAGRCEGASAPLGTALHVFCFKEPELVVLRFHVLIDGRPAAEVWEKYVDRRFKACDVDGDGCLAGDERRGIPSPNVLSQAGLVHSSPRGFLSADTDPVDGKVTNREWRAYLRGAGLEAFCMHFSETPSVLITGSRSTWLPAAAPQVLFEKLDADADGRLSADDFRSASHILRKLDLDRDEGISRTELVPPLESGDSGTTIYREYVAGGSAPQFLISQRGQPPSQDAQRLMDALDGRRSSTASTRDRHLTSLELGLPADALRAFDSNGDDLLNLAELEKLVAEPPVDADVLVRLGDRAPDQPLLEFVGPVSGRLARDGTSVVLGKVQMELAAVTTPDTGLEQLLRSFQAVDRDGNGYLDRTETQRAGIASSLIDSDYDGNLTQQEYVGFYQPWAELEACRVHLEIADRGQDIFRVVDLNGDGRLTPREFLATGERMTDWDANDDGQVELSEIPRKYRFAMGRGALDLVGRAAARVTRIGEAPQGPAWFVQMDRDQDGDVTEREFLGPLDVFRKLDADANGLLDSAEAAKAQLTK